MNETPAPAPQSERHCAYRILRYTPNLVRDEWVNIGVLVFDPQTGERRLRLIEEQEEYARVRRLHRQADVALLRALRDDLENRLEAARATNGRGSSLQELLAKWDDTLANVLQLAPQKGVLSGDLDAELERLYADHVAVARGSGRVGASAGRARIRSYCSQVFRQAGLWERIEKSFPVAEFTFPGDPMRIDFSYRRNGTRGFVHALSVMRAQSEVKGLAYTAQKIQAKARFASEFTAVTDVPLKADNERQRFVRDALRESGIEPVSLEGFATWVPKLKQLIH